MGEVSITIIEKKTNYTVIECARCSGSGEMKTGYTTKITGRKIHTDHCETCSGNGKVKIFQTPPFYECGNCGGSGWIQNKTAANTCSVCNGIGIKSGDELESY